MNEAISKRGSSRPAGALGLLALVIVAVSVAGSLISPSALAEKKPPPPDFVVIVNPKSPVGSAKRDFLADAFLKKTTRWDDGEAIRPVDLPPDSTTRRKFSESVLKRSVAAIRSYWQQRIFSGRGIPPPELESDEAVVAYVLKHRGAVGYVSGGASLGETKVVTVK